MTILKSRQKLSNWRTLRRRSMKLFSRRKKIFMQSQARQKTICRFTGTQAWVFCTDCNISLHIILHMEKCIIRSKAKQNSLHDVHYYINIKSLNVRYRSTVWNVNKLCCIICLFTKFSCMGMTQNTRKAGLALKVYIIKLHIYL